MNKTAKYFEYVKVKSALESHGKFTIVQKVGEGAFGLVVEAKCIEDDKSYAIKILPLCEGERVKYQQRELDLLTRLSEDSEQNVIKHFKSWILQTSNGQQLCIQMELCSVSLEEFVCRNKIGGAKIVQLQGPPRFYQQVFRQILKGLKTIHSMGWVHRDIHPGNILIANPSPKQISDINVKIADFGLARYIGIELNTSIGLTILPKLEQLSPGVGNELFRAPELWTENYDFKVDVYSAGMVLYFISYYLEDSSKWKSEMEALRQGQFGMNASLCHKDDEKLCDVIKNLLQEDPKKRYSAQGAKKYMFPKQAKDSTDSRRVSTKFFATKDDEEDLSRCRLKEFTLSAMKEAVNSGTGVETARQDLRQKRMVNGEKRLIKINCDEDVRAMFKSAAEDRREVELVVREKPPEDSDTEVEQVGYEEENEESSAESL